MSESNHARICIRHAGGSVEILAPAGEVTTLDLTGLHAAKRGRRWRRLGGRTLLACGLIAIGAVGAIGTGAMQTGGGYASSAGLRAALEGPPSLPDLGAAIGTPRPLPPIPSGPSAQPPAADADPFGLKR